RDSQRGDRDRAHRRGHAGVHQVRVGPALRGVPRAPRFPSGLEDLPRALARGDSRVRRSKRPAALADSSAGRSRHPPATDGGDTMTQRRDFLKTTAGVAAGTAVATPALWIPSAHAQWTGKPEPGAKLRVLRWSRFVQGDIDQYMANVKKFTEQTGVEVRVDNEGWEDVRPKAAVAANTGAGPDIILSTNDDANLYPEKLVDVTDLADYLGKKYGGWYPVCEQYLRPDGKNWIGIPLGAAGNCMVYRTSHMKAAGFDSFPKDMDGFLKLCKALKEKGTPAGFALGNATGDGNTWCHWLLWAFGGSLVDKDNKVVINSPETIKALEYIRELYPTFAPGTLA